MNKEGSWDGRGEVSLLLLWVPISCSDSSLGWMATRIRVVWVKRDSKDLLVAVPQPWHPPDQIPQDPAQLASNTGVPCLYFVQLTSSLLQQNPGQSTLSDVVTPDCPPMHSKELINKTEIPGATQASSITLRHFCLLINANRSILVWSSLPSLHGPAAGSPWKPSGRAALAALLLPDAHWIQESEEYKLKGHFSTWTTALLAKRVFYQLS